jgi:hypothetical protein
VLRVRLDRCSPASPPSPSSSAEQTAAGEPQRGLELRPAEWPASLWALIRDWLRPPGSAGGALWKAFSIVSLSSVLASAWLLWRYPEQVMERLLHRRETSMAAIFRRRPESQRQVMELLGSYVQEYQPTQIALIARHSAIGVEEIWANESTAGWPTATGGLMNENMQPALAAMLFDLCWQGQLHHPSPTPRLLRDAPSPWLVCGLSDAEDVWGYVLVHWQGAERLPAGAMQRLDAVSSGIERILF